MEKLVFLWFLTSLLVVPLGSSSDKDCSERLHILARLVDLEVHDDHIGDDDFEGLGSMHWESRYANKILVNVDGVGAVGDGVSDDTKAFLDAWKQACSASNSVLLVPENRRYLVKAARFKGPCAGSLRIQIDGTIVAPDDIKNWDPKNPRTWLVFYNISKVSLQGHGVIDGSGSKWWAASCKRNKTNENMWKLVMDVKIVNLMQALTIDSSSAVKVKDLTIQNGQQMNFAIARSDSIRVTGIKVTAPGDSPNTDGIHITASTDVVLEKCKIGTGDDCVSIVSGSSNIKMKNIFCGPGHGISIGSLGQNNSTGMVEKVVLDSAYLRNTTNGLRIKTWQGGTGHVKGVRYQNVRMDDVSNPIIIDQFYCDSPKTCQNQTSAVEISGIMYRNISGTSKSKEAMTFACSNSVPCTNIVLNNINLQRTDGGTVETYCNSATGFSYGNVHPSAECLLSSDKSTIILQKREADETQSSKEHIIHTEL
ncbi:hypothetical protein OROGR_032546 [Orobanche gracilis]